MSWSAVGRPPFRRRAVAGGVSAAVAGGLFLLAAPSPSAQAASTAAGVQTVCVSGTQGKYARLALLNKKRERLAIYHVRRGCLTFRVGESLPAGEYIIRHRAPRGRLTGSVHTSSGSESPDGTAISGTSLDRNQPLRKVKARGFEMHPTAFGSISFHSVKNRHR